jgi:CarboxypepD_reg-like domain
MKHILTLTLSLIAIQFTYSQKQIHVVDSLTGKGLPFATIECFEKKWGLYTDSAGFASIPENMLQETHKVSYVGYQPKEINFTTTNTITLNRLPQKLEDVTVVSCKETTIEKLEVEETKERSYLTFTKEGIGCIWAVYVKNTTGKPAFIKTLNYNRAGFSKDEKFAAPVRLRFFEYDSISKLPKEEISTSDILVNAEEGKKITNDLSSYKIYVPENGIIIALEMFDAGSQFHYTIVNNMADGTKRSTIHYGWALKMAKSKDVIGFAKAPGMPWKSFSYRDKVVIAPAVSLEIKVCK